MSSPLHDSPSQKLSTPIALTVLQPEIIPKAKNRVVAMVGNPNAGKTTLFNKLTGLRAHTANFPGSTLERAEGTLALDDNNEIMLVDLPGLYSVAGATDEEQVSRDVLLGNTPGLAAPSAVIVVVDATNLERNLFLVSQIIELNLPTLVAVNMTDLAEREGIHINTQSMASELSCEVVSISARTGYGIDKLKETLLAMPAQLANTTKVPHKLQSACDGCSCPFKGRYDWAEQVTTQCVSSPGVTGHRTEQLDRILTHPVAGVFGFFAIMFGVFWLIFSLATVPMNLIDAGFTAAQNIVGHWLPAGDLNNFLTNGVLGGIGGVLVFLPQICILFFCLSLLEDTGYMARAVFVMDRLMRHVGLPGKAFIPMLSAHACAVPAILATRAIEDKRDRLITILVLPLMTCSARLPVYAMVIGLLFGDQPLQAAMLFTSAYSLGIVAALACAFIFKHTILPGQTKPLILELPSYKRPSLRTAFYIMLERSKIFVRKAGTVILLISITLWILSTFPKSDPPPQVVAMQSQAASLTQAGQIDTAKKVTIQANLLRRRYSLEHSMAGRLGKFIEPVIRPLGFDWQIGIGIISSFAAREVIVSTLAIVYGVGENAAKKDSKALIDKLRESRRSDGSKVFTTATCLSLLVFYVLAMQCLPTQVMTRRQTGSWKWAFFQLAYMSILAYSASLATYQFATWLGH